MPGPNREGASRSFFAWRRPSRHFVSAIVVLLVLTLAGLRLLHVYPFSHESTAATDDRSAATPNASQKQISKTDSSSSSALTSATPQKQRISSTHESLEYDRAMGLALKLEMDPRRDDVAQDEVRALAKKLTPSELSVLASLALNEDANGNHRNAAMFVLAMAGERALEQLSSVVIQPVHSFSNEGDAHSRGALQKKYEVALRVRALEELDRLAANSSAGIKSESANQLARVVSQQSQPTIQFLAQMSLQGVREGRPGKLKRFIDQTFAGENK